MVNVSYGMRGVESPKVGYPLWFLGGASPLKVTRKKRIIVISYL